MDSEASVNDRGSWYGLGLSAPAAFDEESSVDNSRGKKRKEGPNGPGSNRNTSKRRNQWVDTLTTPVVTGPSNRVESGDASSPEISSDGDDDDELGFGNRDAPFGSVREIPVASTPSSRYMIPRVDGTDPSHYEAAFTPSWISGPPTDRKKYDDLTMAIKKKDDDLSKDYSQTWFDQFRYREQLLQEDPVYDFARNCLAGLLSLTDSDMILDNKHLDTIEREFERFVKLQEVTETELAANDKEVAARLENLDARLKTFTDNFETMMIKSLPEDGIFNKERVREFMASVEKASSVDKTERGKHVKYLWNNSGIVLDKETIKKYGIPELTALVDSATGAGDNAVLTAAQKAINDLDPVTNLLDSNLTVLKVPLGKILALCRKQAADSDTTLILDDKSPFIGYFVEAGLRDPSSTLIPADRLATLTPFLVDSVKMVRYDPTNPGVFPDQKNIPSLDTLRMFSTSERYSALRPYLNTLSSTLHSGASLVELADNFAKLGELLLTILAGEGGEVFNDQTKKEFGQDIELFRVLRRAVVEESLQYVTSVSIIFLMYVAAYRCMRTVIYMMYTYEISTKRGKIAELYAKYDQSIEKTIGRVDSATRFKEMDRINRIWARFREQRNPAMSGYFLLSPIIVSHIRAASSWLRHTAIVLHRDWRYFSEDPVINDKTKMDEPFRQVFAQIIVYLVKGSRSDGGVVYVSKVSNNLLTRHKFEIFEIIGQYKPPPPVKKGDKQTEVPTLWDCEDD